MGIKRYLRLVGLFARNNLVRELEFRANFYAKIGTNVMWLLSFLIFLKVIYGNTTSIAGWTEAQAFLLFGTFILTRSIMDILFLPNLVKLPELVRLGTMDFVLTKPVNSQFYVSLRYLNLDEIGSFLGAVAIVGYALWLNKYAPTFWQFAAWFYLVVCGVVVLYSLHLLLMTLSFWLVRVDNLAHLVETVVFVGRYPPDIFGKPLAFFLTYIIPLAFVAAVPSLALKEGVNAGWLIMATLLAAVFLAAASGFWRFAARSYTSASS